MSQTLTETANTMRQRFQSEFSALHPSIPIFYAGVPGDPPDTGSWVRWAFQPGREEQVAFGAIRRWRLVAVGFVQIFTEVDAGEGTALALATDVMGIFRGWTSSTVIVRDLQTTAVGSDGKWYQVNVSASVTSDLLAA